MSAGVSVAGMVTEGMGGLRESQAAFRKHHQEVGGALLNISGIDTATGGPVDKDETRPVYTYQAWPKMVYHADGRELKVNTEAEQQDAIRRGFRNEPYIKPRIAVNDPAAEKKALMDTNLQLQAQLTSTNDVLAKMAVRLEQLEAREHDEPKRGPGRPPRTSGE